MVSADFESKLDLSFTYSYDKLSCVKEMWYFHIFMAYVVSLAGVACMVVRLVPAWKWTHLWFGRIYMHAMLWCTASAMLIHNTGLPIAVLVSFVWVLGGLTLGYFIIQIHIMTLQARAQRNVEKRIALAISGGDMKQVINMTSDLNAIIGEEKMRIVNAKSFAERFFSWKSLHGIIMVSSWSNLSGRLFFSNQSGDFTCHTYPVYKQLAFPQYGGDFYKSGNITLVPTHDPSFDKLPWKTGPVGWAVSLMIYTIIMCVVVGAAFSYCYGRGKQGSHVTEKQFQVSSPVFADVNTPMIGGKADKLHV